MTGVTHFHQNTTVNNYTIAITNESWHRQVKK